MSIPKQPSCDDPVETALLPVEEARARLTEALTSISESEMIPITAALNRVLSEDVQSLINVPGHTNSAMDGYALHKDSIPAEGEISLELIGTAWAGQPYAGELGKGQAVRIFTGAIMPDGADTVVIQEHAAEVAGDVRIDSDVVAGKNVRQAGEDIRAGQSVLSAGTWLQAAQLGLLASLGTSEVRVQRKLRVAIFTTGDELRSLDGVSATALQPGTLFDSNRYSLRAMLERLNVDIIDFGIVRDDANATREVFTKTAAAADLIVSSGGVSAGEADFVTRIFHELGDVAFWKLAMRPGRPLAFGKLGDAWFFGLPGNPVAVMITFLQFVQPAIKTLMGRFDTQPFEVLATCLTPLRKSLGRVEYQRGIYQHNEQGELEVRSTGKQGAGILSSMSDANCLIVIDASVAAVESGDKVRVQPFFGLM